MITLLINPLGDQPSWVQAVFATGLGIKPCPIGELTKAILPAALVELTSVELQMAAETLAERM